MKYIFATLLLLTASATWGNVVDVLDEAGVNYIATDNRVTLINVEASVVEEIKAKLPENVEVTVVEVNL